MTAKGDTHIDDHHTVEDIGICLGMALDKALGNKAGISRFGFFFVPLDEALVRAVVDLSGRNYINFALDLPTKKRIGNFDTELVEDFFRAVVDNGKFNLHLEKIHGRNSHHVTEAAFKSFARALKMAVTYDSKVKGIPSTKGNLNSNFEVSILNFKLLKVSALRKHPEFKIKNSKLKIWSSR